MTSCDHTMMSRDSVLQLEVTDCVSRGRGGREAMSISLSLIIVSTSPLYRVEMKLALVLKNLGAEMVNAPD